ncbi:hypothetical protein ACF0H5_016300 [Mactra antiquata]
MYLIDFLHTALVSKISIQPLRISKVSVQVLGETDLYLDVILLDSFPLVSFRIDPLPQNRHYLEASIAFLTGTIAGKWQVSVNTTLGNIPVVLESRGLKKLDYRSEFITTPSTSTATTTYAAPPLRTKTPLPNKPCECQTSPSPACPTTKTIVPSSPCPTVKCPSPPITQGCTTQKTSCPPCTTVNCPACSTPAPCPTVKCPSPPITQGCTTQKTSCPPCIASSRSNSGRVLPGNITMLEVILLLFIKLCPFSSGL